MSGKSKNLNHETTEQYIDLLYMSPTVVSAKDISIILRDIPGLKIELWEEMNIIELELSNQNCVDFELMEPYFKAPTDAAFVKNRNIQTIYAINLCESDLTTLLPAFETIIEKHFGFLCGDTEDFTPVYAGSSAKI
jgi:hypothetical protein